MKTSKFLRSAILSLTVCLGFLGFNGCSTSGGTFTIFPTGHFLLSSTKQLAAEAPVPAPTPRELDLMVLPAYYVAPGDTLLVEPLSFESTLRFPTDQRVLVDGTIELERYGRLVVAGRTVEQIEEMIHERIMAVDGKVENINVRLIEHPGAVYYVLGEVNTPGSYPLIGRETVLDAILAAGGLTQRASTCNIILSRPTYPDSCRVVLPVCYREITQLGDTTTNYQLMPGDRIFVATRTLTEELLPCNSRRPCKLCGGLQCACVDPSAAQYGPAFSSVPAEPLGVTIPVLPAQPTEAPPIPPAK